MHKKKLPRVLSMLLVMALMLQSFATGVTVSAEGDGSATLLLNALGITTIAGGDGYGNKDATAPAGTIAQIGGEISVSKVLDTKVSDTYIRLRVEASGGDIRNLLEKTDQTFFGDMVSSADYMYNDEGALTEIRLNLNPLAGSASSFLADVRFKNGYTPDGAKVSFIPSVWQYVDGSEPVLLLAEDRDNVVTLTNTSSFNWKVNTPAASLAVAHMPDTPVGTVINLPMIHRPAGTEANVFNTFTFTSLNNSEKNPSLGMLFTESAALTGTIRIPAYMLPEGVTELTEENFRDYFVFLNGEPDSVSITKGTVDYKTALGNSYISKDIDCWDISFTWNKEMEGNNDLSGHSYKVGLQNLVFKTSAENKIYMQGSEGGQLRRADFGILCAGD